MYFNGLFGYLDNLVSSQYKNVYTSQIKMNEQYIGNIFYDVNPAVRVAFEYTYIKTYWNGYTTSVASQLTNYALAPGSALSTQGVVQEARIAFFYFF